MLRNLLLFICGVALAVAIALPASATPLSDAVDDYNSSASGLQTLYDAFLNDQDAAFADFQSMIDNLAYYIMEDDIDDALAYWCLCVLEFEGETYEELVERGYTDAMIQNFCDTYGPQGLDYCSDEGMSDQKKAAAVRNGAQDSDDSRPKLEEDLDKVEEVVGDYLMSA
ncbi:MAG: hypothetical protein B1H03_03930 [Planctomycetales bacterium 4484_113]|nr:MAG: hypothetical protein B1H03_03930 [Planctomycetales bacterium 4484_113]